MAKLGFLRRLVKEDFKPDDQEFISKVAFILNPAFESITNALNKNLTFTDNLNAQVKELNVTVVSGQPIQALSFRSELKGSCKAIWCVRAENQTNTATYVSGAPFISFSESQGQILINHITGLQDNQEYKLRIIATV